MPSEYLRKEMYSNKKNITYFWEEILFEIFESSILNACV